MNAQYQPPTDDQARPGFSDLDYSESPSVAGLMADTLRKTNPAIFAHCADSFDCSPAVHLRGLSYLIALLGEDQEASPRMRSMAANVIADHVGLMAVWLDMQTAAEIDRLHGDGA